MIRALIVDDEDLPRQLLREYLAACPDVELAGESANGLDAVKACNELRPDLMFLDVQMPKLDGFEVLELLEHIPAVVFTTAFDQYALRAFDAHAVDYLLKPFSLDRFQLAMQRVRERLSARENHQANDPASLNAAVHGPDHPLSRIVVRDRGKITLIPVERLLCIEAQDDYIALHTVEKSYLKKQAMSQLESALDPQQFVRVHRSWIVNLTAVSRVEPYSRDTFVAVLQGGRHVPVSRSGHKRLMELLS
jgi:two-component system LytT family response regulator